MAVLHRRKTRIVCISDTHNQTPSLPKGDVLIHAGDLTNQGSYSEMKKTAEWIEKLDFEVKIIVGGNHDITLDSKFYENHWQYFHNQGKQSSGDCLALLEDSSSITYLSHSSTHIKLSSPRGPHTQFTVFGSPYSPAHGLWAFGYKPENAARFWSEIPLDTDIIVTHTPPSGHCDQSVTKTGHAGCEELRRQLWRVRPILHVCGHLHEGRGVEKVKWKMDALSPIPYMEEATEYWVDPGAGEQNKKQSIVDLTGRGKDSFSSVPVVKTNGKGSSSVSAVKSSRKWIKPKSSATGLGTSPTPSQIESLATIDPLNHLKKNATIHGLGDRHAKDNPWHVDEAMLEPKIEIGDAGLDRADTCIVNAAIMANKWGGPKRFNKPIVVDIDMPVWEE